MSNPEENLPPPPEGPPPGYTPPPPSGPPPGYMPPPPSGPPPGYQAPPPGYVPPPPGYQQPPPGYGTPPGFGAGAGYQPQGGVPPTGNMQAQLQAFIRNAQGVITKPSVASFDAIQPYANWNTILITLGIAAATQGVSNTITGALFRSSYTLNGSTFYYGYNPFGSFIGGIIGTLLKFFIATGVWWLIARYLFKGTGTFLNYAHAISLIYVPLFVVTAVFGLIPVLGGLASFAAGIYALYLVVLATASTHRLPMDRSIWTVLIPIIAGFVLALLIVVFAAAVLIGLGIHLFGR